MSNPFNAKLTRRTGKRQSSSSDETTHRKSMSWIRSNEKNGLIESMDFEEVESVAWRRHQLRRFFQDRGKWWTSSRKSTAWKWTLCVMTGFFIGCVGYLVARFTEALSDKKFELALGLANDGKFGHSYTVFMMISVSYALIAGVLCVFEPNAAASGIPEIKAYLNGVNLRKAVRIRVLIVKVIGMCFSVAAGLALGKEGPMIHAGSIIGAAVSQGKTVTFGVNTSWTKFQDLRNDRAKRDYITYGAAAGVAAAFSAPIGGILFTLEEGASFWSTTLTFRAFFCAMITQLTLNLLYSGLQLGINHGSGLFAFGYFDNFGGYATYELVLFALMGAAGGVMGSVFNDINRRVTEFRMNFMPQRWKRLLELGVLAFVTASVAYLMPVIWGECTNIPTDTANMSTEQLALLNKLVQFHCDDGQYNQVASLFLVPSDTAMQQLYHFVETTDATYVTFETGALVLFFIPYFFLAAYTAGSFCPAGLFVPTLLAGAAFGRLIGHILTVGAPGYATDSGTYALVGAAALLGGMSRLTIAGTVIILEACGNSQYLLPLMITFAAARYVGNAIDDPLYEILIDLKKFPFLDGSLKSLGLLNNHPVAEIMRRPVITFNQVCKVGDLHEVLSTTNHNGFPVVSKNGHLRGMMLRKHLCTILQLRAFSAPAAAAAAQQAYNRGDCDFISSCSSGSSSRSHDSERKEGDVAGDVCQTELVTSLGRQSTSSSMQDRELSTTINPLAAGDASDDKRLSVASNPSGMAPVSIAATGARVKSTEAGTLNDEKFRASLAAGKLKLEPATTVFHDSLESRYPQYPRIEDIDLSPEDMECWLDLRTYMDTAPYAINSSASVRRAYNLFRTMGIRHLIVLDGDHRVDGILTRHDLTHHRLEHHWFDERDNMSKFLSVESTSNKLHIPAPTSSDASSVTHPVVQARSSFSSASSADYSSYTAPAYAPPAPIATSASRAPHAGGGGRRGRVGRSGTEMRGSGDIANISSSAPFPPATSQSLLSRKHYFAPGEDEEAPPSSPSPVTPTIASRPGTVANEARGSAASNGGNVPPPPAAGGRSGGNPFLSDDEEGV